MTKTKFPWALWYWTNADESLFVFSRAELYLFKVFVDEANK